MRHASHLLPMRTRMAGVAIAIVALAAARGRARARGPAAVRRVRTPTIGDFNPVTLNGTDQLTSATISPVRRHRQLGHASRAGTSRSSSRTSKTAPAPTVRSARPRRSPARTLSMNAPLVSAADGLTAMTGVTAAGFTDFTAPRTIISAAAGDGRRDLQRRARHPPVGRSRGLARRRVLHPRDDRDHVGSVSTNGCRASSR